MGYFDENENNEYSFSDEINDINKAKSSYDDAKKLYQNVKDFRTNLTQNTNSVIGNSASQSVTAANSATDSVAAASTASEAAKTASSEAAKKVTKEATKEGAKEVAKQTAKTAMKTAGKTAAKIASQAVSGPAGWAMLAKDLVKSGQAGKIIAFAVFGVLLLIIVTFIIILAPIILAYEKASEIYQDAKYEAHLYKQYYTVGELNFNDQEDFWNHIYEKYDIKPEDMNSAIDLYGAEAEMNLNICKEIIDNAIDWAFKAPRKDGGGYWTMFVQSDSFLGKWFEATWDWLAHDNTKMESYNSFLNSQYPYTLAESGPVTLKDGSLGEHFYYSIEDYMENRIPDDKLNNDLNYAEVITAMCLNKDMDAKNFSFQKFYSLLMNRKTRRNFAELTCKEGYYFGKDSKNNYPDLLTMATKNGYSSIDELKEAKGNNITAYLKYEVFPYGLLELFDIVDEPIYAQSYKSGYTNYRMLDQYENVYRENLKWTNIKLGPGLWDTRDWHSKAYYNAIKDASGVRGIGTTTGRSAYTYVDVENILYGDLFMLEEWDSANKVYDTILYYPTGKSKILDFNSSSAPNKYGSGNVNYERDYSVEESHSYYICQLDYPNSYRGPKEDGSTIYNEGCTDCCYTMCAQYFLNRDISIEGVSASFCANGYFKSGGTFRHTKSGTEYVTEGFLNSVGLYKLSHRDTFNQSTIVKQIDLGIPTVFCIYGSWWSLDGKTLYHRGIKEGAKQDTTHFITIIGYDDNYFYVLDPANRSRTKIPLKDFLNATIMSWNIVSDAPDSDNEMFFRANNYRFAYSKLDDSTIYINGVNTGIERPEDFIDTGASEKSKTLVEELAESLSPTQYNDNGISPLVPSSQINSDIQNWAINQINNP